jgi:tripartite ATP-independent transporter DctM subunit
MSVPIAIPDNRAESLVAPGSSRVFKAENGMLAAALSLMALIPVAEMVLRALLHTGIFGAAAIVQHLGLAVGMLGAGVAARNGRLLALSVLPLLLEGRKRVIITTVAYAVAAAVCLLLAAAGVQFVSAERLAGKWLTHGVPIWTVQALIPMGFSIIAWRLLRHAIPSLAARGALLVAVGLFVFILAPQSPPPAPVMQGALVVLAVAALLGAPLFAILGGIALTLIWGEGYPLASVAVDHYRMVVNPTLPAIPLFTLAGYFLAESGAPRRLLRVFQSLFGSWRGGAAGVAVVGSTLLTSVTGASGVTILALGGLLLPMLMRWGYHERPAVGVVAGAGLPGVLLAPSLPLILYAIVAEVSVQDIFLGALPPALLMILLVFLWSRWQGSDSPREVGQFVRGEAYAALRDAKWELALPVVAVIALFSGLATPVEAAAITALYAFVVEVLIHRDLKLVTDVPRVMVECGLLVGGILLILGVALGLTNYLVDAQLPERLTVWIEETVRHRWLFLLALNLFLLLAGCLMDVYSAIIVLTPLIVPIGRAFDVDPVHLGVVFLANLELGYLTPPVGINLFYAAYRFNRPLLEVCRTVATLIPVLALGVLVITYAPILSRLLPDLFR